MGNHIDTHDKSPITSKWETQRSRLRRGDWSRSAESYSLLRDLLRESWLLSLRLSTTSVLSSTDHQQTPRPPFHAIDRSVQGHPNTTRPREAPKSCPNRCCQGAMGEGWYGLREIQGHEIEKATAIRGPKVVGKG